MIGCNISFMKFLLVLWLLNMVREFLNVVLGGGIIDV